ncbi:MAG: cytochrome c [Hyphomicrobium denitrificans]|mgnify:CR=1 FL=1|uniref:Cytochrome c class I n=1 Tax=Hyphomicrobium denitrificans (strain ATCC 51888 / DSM 1869 / NCIMB 11706 / TK 0415) TaxID=582899 RepID=D8JV52_HYPDA|nr:cytochrome c [Hyphomicrobium denitrificans]ADJ22868.1 cytochrome c class I [Hyphomicrobium denitrificans ATCC 51888]MBN9289764.1 cytochrome c [Hyphomicrobium denitrificans]
MGFNLRADRVALVASLLFWLGGGTAVAAPDTPQIDGAAILEKNCSRCHAIGMTGDSTHKEAPPFREIVMRYPPENLEESLAEGIVSGHADMPEFTFSSEEVSAIVGYLNDLKAQVTGK